MSSRSIVVALVFALLACAGIVVLIVGQRDHGSTPSPRSGTEFDGANTAAGGTRGAAKGGAAPAGSSETVSTSGGAARPGAAAAPADPRRPTGAGKGADAGRKAPAGLCELVVFVEAAAAPIAGARVALAGAGGGSREAETREDGAAEFTALPPGSYRVGVEAEGFAAARSSREVTLLPGRSQSLRLVLEAFDLAIAGRVLSAAGEPLEAVEVAISPLPRGADELALVSTAFVERLETDAAGRFRFEGLAAGEYLLETRSGGRAGQRRQVLAPAEDLDLVFYEEETLLVAGTVSDAAGQALSGARIVLPVSGDRTQSDAAGAFELRVGYRRSPDAAFIVSAEKDGYTSAQETIFIDKLEDPERAQVDFKLEPAGELASVVGRLIDEAGEAVAGERVYLRSSTLNLSYNAASDAEGRFGMPAVRVGADYRLWVYPRRRYRDFTVFPQEIHAGENAVELVLEPLETGAFEALLRDPEGRPLARFTVQIRSSDSLANTISLTSDDAGRIRGDEVPSGALLIETRALPKLNVRGLSVPARGELKVEIVVGVGEKTISGAVADRGGSPVPGARVILNWSGEAAGVRSSLYQEAATDASGAFVIRGFGSGAFAVAVNAAGFKPWREAFTLEPADPGREVKAQLEPAAGR